jgi:hypothetical protein
MLPWARHRCAEPPTGQRFPNLHGLVLVARRQPGPVGAKGDRSDAVRIGKSARKLSG